VSGTRNEGDVVENERFVDGDGEDSGEVVKYIV
jgi:hypothetical protein